MEILQSCTKRSICDINFDFCLAVLYIVKYRTIHPYILGLPCYTWSNDIIARLSVMLLLRIWVNESRDCDNNDNIMMTLWYGNVSALLTLIISLMDVARANGWTNSGLAGNVTCQLTLAHFHCHISGHAVIIVIWVTRRLKSPDGDSFFSQNNLGIIHNHTTSYWPRNVFI